MQTTASEESIEAQFDVSVPAIVATRMFYWDAATTRKLVNGSFSLLDGLLALSI
jgi:hypothetical protein